MAIEPLISQSRLRELALDQNVELKVNRLQARDQQLETQQGSWGGRAMRWLRGGDSQFGDPQLHMDAKTEVLRTLKEMYGDEIGAKVFRVNIGHMEGDRHLSNKQFPITGRHIRQMIEQGDREILRKYGRPENGGVSFGQTGLKIDGEQVPSERSTVDWMLRKSVGMSGPNEYDPPYLTGSFDRRGMDLRSERVGPDDGNVEVRGEPVAQLLLDDRSRRPGLGPQDNGHVWTLDIYLPNGNQHQIGLRVDPQDPGKVNVFDARRGEYSVPHEDLGAWLNAHLEKNYSVEGLQLYRSEETMPDDRFVKQGTDHVFERRYDVRDEVSKEMLDYFDSEAKKRITFGNRDPLFEIAQQFKTDLHRLNTQVTQQGSSTVLSTDNWETQLAGLVGKCNEEELRHGVFNLTAMLNQALGNSIAGVGIVNSLADLGGAPPQSAGLMLQQVKVEKDETTGMVRIDVMYSQPYSELQIPDEPKHLLDLRSRLHCSVSIEIPVDALRQSNGYQQFKLVDPPDIRLELISQVGPRDGRNPDGVKHANVALFRDGERLVSQSVGAGAEDELLKQCMRDGESWREEGQFLSNTFVQHLKSSPRSVVFDLGDVREEVNLTGVNGPRLRDLPGVNEVGANTLSFLLAPSIGEGLHESLMRDALHDPQFKLGQDKPPLSTTITPVALPDGQQALEIEYRGSIPEGLLESHPGTVLHHMDGKPQARFGFDTVVRIRVPVDQLNQGNPGAFDYVHPNRIEGRPLPNQE